MNHKLSGEIQANTLSFLDYLREQGVTVTIRQETTSNMPESIRQALLDKIISKIPQHEIVEWLKTMERGNNELDLIKTDLVARKPVNSVTAFTDHYITRLSSIIKRLRDKGYPIVTTLEHGNGLAHYSLPDHWQP